MKLLPIHGSRLLPALSPGAPKRQAAISPQLLSAAFDDAATAFARHAACDARASMSVLPRASFTTTAAGHGHVARRRCALPATRRRIKKRASLPRDMGAGARLIEAKH